MARPLTASVFFPHAPPPSLPRAPPSLPRALAAPVSPLNAAGTALALGGVFAYSYVKKLQGKLKAE